MLRRHERSATPFAAEREALRQSQQHQQHRSEGADGGICRQQADQYGGDAHDQDGDDHHRFSANPVPEVTEDDGSDRTGDEAGGEGREGQQGSDGRVEAGEEVMVEHEHGCGAVDEEVVPLDGCADQARQCDLLRRACARWSCDCTTHIVPPGYLTNMGHAAREPVANQSVLGRLCF